MSRSLTPPDRDFQIRCPRLGHQIYFDYCRGENMGQPCFKILDCWFTFFKVEEFLRVDMGTREFIEFINNPGQPKMLSLAEMIAQAQKSEP